jgi:hypothetical protein
MTDPNKVIDDAANTVKQGVDAVESALSWGQSHWLLLMLGALVLGSLLGQFTHLIH